jgi:hypothetical protein
VARGLGVVDVFAARAVEFGVGNVGYVVLVVVDYEEGVAVVIRFHEARVE